MKKFVIKPGFFEQKRTGKSQPGLDLWRVTLDTLVDRSLAITEDCCNYYPTAPTIYVVDDTSPTEAEMDNGNIPVKGFFFAEEESGGVWSFLVRTSTNTSVSLATND